MGSEWNKRGFDNDENYINEEDYAFQTLMRNGKPKTLSMSLASLIIGVLSLTFGFLGWSGIILGATAVVLSILSRRRLGYFDGMSVGGLILGIFGFVFGVSIIIAVNFLITEEMLDEFFEQFKQQFEENTPSDTPGGPGSGI